jgi:hypothetical protein
MARHETYEFFESHTPVVICKGILKVWREVLIELCNDNPGSQQQDHHNSLD